jgi:prefoldin subunit 5
MEPMITRKEMEQRAEKKQSLAWKYERTREELQSATSALRSLEAKLAAPKTDVAALGKVLEHAKNIPSSIVTEGKPVFGGGGIELRALIEHEVNSALGRLSKQRKALEDELPKAQGRLADAERRMADVKAAWAEFQKPAANHASLHAKVPVKVSGTIEVRQ